MKKKLALAIVLAITPSLGFSQTAWTDGGADGIWTNVSNWTGGVPTTTSSVFFDGGSFPDPDPITHVIVVNDGTPTTIGSLTVNATTPYLFSFVSGGSDTLRVNGGLTNLSANSVSIQLEYTFGSNTVNGPFSFASIVNTGTQNVSVTDAVSFTNNLFLTLTNNSTYGRYGLNAGASLGLAGAVVKIDPSSTYTGVSGDVFQLFNTSAGSWSGVSNSTLDVSSLPALSGGLTWNTSAFTTNGSLSVVPEPTTWLLLSAGLTAIAVFRRRQQS
jgi:hypothetical protein